MTPERLAEIEAIANAATPGPWPHANKSGAVVVDGRIIFRMVYASTADEDFVVSALAREDVPALIAEVRRLRGERDLARTETAFERVTVAERNLEIAQLSRMNALLAKGNL